MITAVFAASEPSKIPFYIAGAVLVGWAVLLASLGLKRPSFPYSARGSQGVMSVSAVLAAVTIAMAIVTS